MELKQLKRYLLKLPQNDLEELRDITAQLLDAYAGHGVVFGKPTFEMKTITKKYPKIAVDKSGKAYIVTEKDENGEKRIVYNYVVNGPYAYIRQWGIDEKGKLTLTTNGYYGKAGVDAVNMGQGNLLLEAHVRGGESEGDAFLMQLELSPPTRRRPADELIPASRPVHPLQDEKITSANVSEQPIYQYFLEHAPIDAEELMVKLRNFEHDLFRFDDANARKLILRDSLETIESKRKRAKRKLGNPINH